jgi:uncharacterized membrane protein
MRKVLSVLLRSFLQGLILLSPIAITAYIIFLVFTKVDGLIPKVPPGIGFISIVSFVALVGYLGTRLFIGRWLFEAFGHVLKMTPGIKYIYSSVRDIMRSFVGDKKRFNKPVWVMVNANPQVWRIGFLTQSDMGPFGMTDMVSVYLPHAYAISGWVIVTNKNNTKPAEGLSPAEAMKFALSGGVTTIQEDDAQSEF